MQLLKFDITDKNDIVEHICSLSPEDRYLRFAYAPTDAHISAYVEQTLKTVNTKTKSDYWFGIKDSGKIIGTIHIGIVSGVAEFGFTTDAAHRGKKIGQHLFARGYQLVTEHCISQIYLACLSTNAPMRHIAKKFGLAVVSHGPETEASVTISYPVSLDRIQEIKMSIIDKNIGKAQKQ